jgi:hypothetical protein
VPIAVIFVWALYGGDEVIWDGEGGGVAFDDRVGGGKGKEAEGIFSLFVLQAYYYWGEGSLIMEGSDRSQGKGIQDSVEGRVLL